MTAWRSKREPETWREIIRARHRTSRLRRRILVLLALVAGTVVAVVLYVSQVMIAPPRPRVSESVRPVLGIETRESPEGGVAILRAVSPARDAGLRVGDRIIALDEEPVSRVEDISSRVALLTKGDLVRVEARRPEPGGGEGGVLVDVAVDVRPVSPFDLGLDYEEVAFSNPSGLVLRGWYLPPAAGAPAPAIAYGHGKEADRRQWLHVADDVHDAGFGQLLFDFAGRGESEGDVITLGAREAGDLRAALEFLATRREVDRDRLFMVGRSMGAVAAVLVAAEGAPVRGLVLDSPYADLGRLADETLHASYLPAWPLRPLAFKVAGWRAGYDPGGLRPVEAIAGNDVPTLVFHGTEDEVVAIAHSEELVRSGGERVRLVPLEGQGHDDIRPDEVTGALVRFLRSLM